MSSQAISHHVLHDVFGVVTLSQNSELEDYFVNHLRVGEIGDPWNSAIVVSIGHDCQVPFMPNSLSAPPNAVVVLPAVVPQIAVLDVLFTVHD